MGCVNGTGMTFSIEPGVNALLLVKSASNTGPCLTECFTSLHQSRGEGLGLISVEVCLGWQYPAHIPDGRGVPMAWKHCTFQKSMTCFFPLCCINIEIYTEKVGHTPASHLLEKTSCV